MFYSDFSSYLDHLLSWAFLGKIFQIIWIDLLVSGDNAVVIALACRNLPRQQRHLGLLLGSGMAIFLRILCAFVAFKLMAWPGLKIVGGGLLLWIAWRLLPDEKEKHDVSPAASLWRAVRDITMADFVMSLDNVLALAAVSEGSIFLLVLGLLLSFPLLIVGSGFLMKIVQTQHWVVEGGAILLGWIAGGLIFSDPSWPPVFEAYHFYGKIGGSLLVVAFCYFYRKKRSQEGGLSL